MTGNAVAQVAIYVALVVAVTLPLGAYMERVFTAKPTFIDPVMRPVERAIYRVCGITEAAEMGGSNTPSRCCCSAWWGCWCSTRLSACKDICRSIRRTSAGPRRTRLQYRGQLHHQHQLAGLRRRIDHELPDPDGGAGVSQFRLRCGGNRGGDRGDSRLRAAQREDDR